MSICFPLKKYVKGKNMLAHTSQDLQEIYWLIYVSQCPLSKCFFIFFIIQPVKSVILKTFFPGFPFIYHLSSISIGLVETAHFRVSNMLFPLNNPNSTLKYNVNENS